MAAERPLSGKTAVVMGGSGGIGAATARLLAEAGASVLVHWRGDEAAAKAVVASLPPGNHFAGRADIEDSASLAALAATAKERWAGSTFSSIPLASPRPCRPVISTRWTMR